MADSTMKTLINNVKTFLETAITNNDIDAVKVFKGLKEDPQLIPHSQMPYIAIDDGGERTEIENPDASTTQRKYYTLLVEVGAYSAKDLSTAMDKLLDIYQQVKETFELKANKKLDGMTFGIQAIPFEFNEDRFFFRGRTVTIEYNELEDRYFES